jgi:hypothetical protein
MAENGVKRPVQEAQNEVYMHACINACMYSYSYTLYLFENIHIFMYILMCM